MSHTMLMFVTLSMFATGACGKKEEGGGGGGGTAKAATAAVATKLPKVGLQADIPGEEVRVDDGMSEQSHMVNTVVMGGMMVEITATPQKLEEVKADAEMMTPKNLKTETLADGFVVTFENSGSMGTNYWVDVRRTIDGKSVKCSSTGSKAEQAAAVVTACKSLRK